MIICGDAQEVLKTLESGSIDCVITSPPYWGQRFYGNISEIGSERTPEEYIERLFVVCREIKRVLKKSGTFWLNISDTYYSPSRKRLNGAGSCRIGRHPFLKRKDLCLIPERLVDWLQKDGWYVRSVVIWFKVNSRPESVKDRLVNDYEFLFLLTKSPRYYFKVIRGAS